MLGSEIYLKAAEMVHDLDDLYSCTAIYRASEFKIRFCSDYEHIFRPEDWKSALWGEAWGNDRERKACRVLALLLMAEIAKDEERK